MKKNKTTACLKNILIIGAGVAGRMVCDEIISHTEINYRIVGFIDDNTSLKPYKTYKTLGSINDIGRVIKKFFVDMALIAIPSASGRLIRQIIEKCNKLKIEFRIVPGIFKIITGDVKLSQIREVKPEDLLGRETVNLDISGLAAKFRGKTALVTGGAGSIGSELCAQITKLKIKRLVVIDQNESELFYLEQNLVNAGCEKIFGVCDITNLNRLKYFFNKYRPEFVFHAAAYKHVPLMESNVYEAANVNIVGSDNIFALSSQFGVEQCLLISSDKAVNPTSVMGATKSIAEKLLINYSEKNNNKTAFSAVRFGNVLGSRGSVVPLFINQIKSGGPITITHPEIYRFFMTISEAVSLVLNSVLISHGGEIFVLDMGEQINITELAKNLITLSGLTPGKDIKITYTGLRPGEKLYEELLTSEDKVNATKMQKIFIARPVRLNKRILLKNISNVKKLLTSSTDIEIKIREIIRELTPEFTG